MQNHALKRAIIVQVILWNVIPFAHPTVVLAQTPVCYDENRRMIPCPPEPEQPQPEQEEKTKPTRTPIPPSSTATTTVTSSPTTPPTMTPSVTSIPSLTSTAVPILPILPAADAGPPGPFPFAGGPGFWFGLLGLVVLLLILLVRRRPSALEFILGRAPTIDYDHPEDTDLFFEELEPKGDMMPLLTEFEIPDSDAHSKESKYMELHEPGSDKPTAAREPSRHVQEEPQNYYEEEGATRTGEVAPKKFPKSGDQTDQNTGKDSDGSGRSSNDDD